MTIERGTIVLLRCIPIVLFALVALEARSIGKGDLNVVHASPALRTTIMLEAEVRTDPRNLKCGERIEGKEAFDDVEEALRYLRKSTNARRFAERLRKVDQSIVIVVNRCRRDQVTFQDNDSAIIEWDPHDGLITTEGMANSPALALIHEVVHLMHAREDPKKFEVEANRKCGTYDTCEERRTIIYGENAVAADLGEYPRSDHQGEDWHAPDPAPVDE